MEGHDAQPSVPRHLVRPRCLQILIIGVHRVDQIAIDSKILAVRRHAAGDVPAQNKVNIWEALEPAVPTLFAIVIAEQVRRVAVIYASAISKNMAVSDDDDVLVEVTADDSRCPVEGLAAGNIFQDEEQIWLVVDVQDAVKVLIAALRVAASLFVTLVIVAAGVPVGPPPVVEAGGYSVFGASIGAIVVMVADCEHGGDAGVIQKLDGGISVPLLLIGSAIVHNVADSEHHLDIEVLAIVHDPSRLAIHHAR